MKLIKLVILKFNYKIGKIQIENILKYNFSKMAEMQSLIIHLPQIFEQCIARYPFPSHIITLFLEPTSIFHLISW